MLKKHPEFLQMLKRLLLALRAILLKQRPVKLLTWQKCQPVWLQMPPSKLPSLPWSHKLEPTSKALLLAFRTELPLKPLHANKLIVQNNLHVLLAMRLCLLVLLQKKQLVLLEIQQKLLRANKLI
jgi:hypothetical protein